MCKVRILILACLTMALLAVVAGIKTSNRGVKHAIYCFKSNYLVDALSCRDQGNSRGAICVWGSCPSGWRRVFWDSGCRSGQRCCI